MDIGVTSFKNILHVLTQASQHSNFSCLKMKNLNSCHIQERQNSNTSYNFFRSIILINVMVCPVLALPPHHIDTNLGFIATYSACNKSIQVIYILLYFSFN